jgi:hypothetical protein
LQVPNWYLWCTQHSKRWDGVTKPRTFYFKLIDAAGGGRGVQVQLKDNMVSSSPWTETHVLETTTLPKLSAMRVCPPKHMRQKLINLKNTVTIFSDNNILESDDIKSWKSIIQEMELAVDNACSTCLELRQTQYEHRSNKHDEPEVAKEKSAAYKEAYNNLNRHLQESNTHKVLSQNNIWPFHNVPEQKAAAAVRNRRSNRRSNRRRRGNSIDEESTEVDAGVCPPNESKTELELMLDENEGQMVGIGRRKDAPIDPLKVGDFIIMPVGVINADISNTAAAVVAHHNKYDFWVAKLTAFDESLIGQEAKVHWWGNTTADVLKDMFPGWLRNTRVEYNKRKQGQPYEGKIDKDSIIMWFDQKNLFTKKRARNKGPTNKIAHRSLKKIFERLLQHKNISEEAYANICVRLGKRSRK